MNVICVNCKEVYAIRPDQCTHCGGQTFEKTQAAVYPENTGTITWFEYPNHVPTKKRGLWVLCYYGPNCPIDTCYYWGMLNKFTNDKKPTHFAYLNKPEPSQD
jgi:hypothetical protein